MRRPDWRGARATAQGGQTGQLELALTQAATPGEDERQRLFEAALSAAERHADYKLLMWVLEQLDTDALRTAALATALMFADELHPHFGELLGSLRARERELILGARFAALGLSDPERRLLRLYRLVKLSPLDSRSRYWLKAEALAGRGGDDAQLILLGFVRALPQTARPPTLGGLQCAVRKVQNASKRALAFVAFADIMRLSEDDLREAKVSAARIPDETLRIMVLK